MMPTAGLNDGDDDERAIVAGEKRKLIERNPIDFGYLAKQVAGALIVMIAAELIANVEPSAVTQEPESHYR